MRGAGLIFLAVLLVSGCGCTETGLAGRTDAGHDVPPDTSYDALDIGTDPIIDYASEPLIDVSPDSHPDPSPDLPRDAPVSTCNVIDQTGCPEGQWCSWRFDEDACMQYESCFTRAPGLLDVEERCNPLEPEPETRCRPGTECGPFGRPEIIACYEWCRTDDDCSVPGRTCTISMDYIPGFGPCAGIYIRFPYQLCTLE